MSDEFKAAPLTLIAEDFTDPAAPRATRRVASDNLAEHIYNTYWWLRFGLGSLAFAYPLIIVLAHRPDPLHATPGAVDWFGSDSLRGSLSAYYDSHQVGYFFIGGLFAVGFCLVVYRGFSQKENAVLNAAGLFGLGVALIPYNSGVGEFELHPFPFGCPVITAHGSCAILLFVSLWYVAWFRSSDTLYGYKSPDKVKRYRFWYRLFSLVMVAGVLVASAMRGVAAYRPFTTLLAEAIGIWGFSGYWLLKSLEIWRRSPKHFPVVRTVPLDTTR